MEVATVRNFKPSSEFSIEFLCLDNDGHIFGILGGHSFNISSINLLDVYDSLDNFIFFTLTYWFSSTLRPLILNMHAWVSNSMPSTAMANVVLTLLLLTDPVADSVWTRLTENKYKRTFYPVISYTPYLTLLYLVLEIPWRYSPR